MSAPMCAGTVTGAVSLKKPHHIITLCEIVKDHAKYLYVSARSVKSIFKFWTWIPNVLFLLTFQQ